MNIAKVAVSAGLGALITIVIEKAIDHAFDMLGISNKFIPLINVSNKLAYLRRLKAEGEYVPDTSTLELAFAKNGQLNF